MSLGLRRHNARVEILLRARALMPKILKSALHVIVMAPGYAQAPGATRSRALGELVPHGVARAHHT